MADAKSYSDHGGAMAANWLIKARAAVDEQFGEGYALANPALVAAMVQASALHFHASWLGRAMDDHGLHSGG